MTEITNEKPAIRWVNVPRLLSMLIRPSRAFSPMPSDARGSWLTPMLALTISSILVVLVTGYLETRAALAGVVELPPDWEFWTTEMQENFLQAQQATQGPVFAYILPLVGSLVSLWLGWVVFSAIMRLVSTLLGGRGSLQSALNVVGWANTPFVIRDGLRIVFMLVAGHGIVSPGLSGFVESGFISQFLSRIDLFLFWNIALLAIGFAVVDGLPKGKALIGILVIVLILLAIQAGLGAVVLSFESSAAALRPTI